MLQYCVKTEQFKELYYTDDFHSQILNPICCSLLKSGIRFHLSPVQLLHSATVRGHLRGVGGVWLDSLFGGVHASPWLPGLPVSGGGLDGRLVHRLGEEECGDPERDRRPRGGPHAQAAEGERGAGETGGREGGTGRGKGRKCCSITGGPSSDRWLPSFFLPSSSLPLSLRTSLSPLSSITPFFFSLLIILHKHKEFSAQQKPRLHCAYWLQRGKKLHRLSQKIRNRINIICR